MIRYLDSLEEFFWLLRTPGVYRYVCAMTVEGSTSSQEWQAAWRAIHPTFDVLTASILKEAGRRPAFVRTDCYSKLSLLPVSSLPDVDATLAAELNDNSPEWVGTLIRATLFHHPQRSLFVLTAHHSGSDGNTCTAIFRCLLDALTGQSEMMIANWLSSTAVVGRPTPVAYWRILPGKNTFESVDDTHSLPSLKTRTIVLDAKATQNLMMAAKSNRTTIHSALMVATALAIQPHVRHAEHGVVRCSTPISIRSFANVDFAAGVLISMFIANLAIRQDEIFWGCARRVQEELRVERGLSSVQRRAERLNDMMADELTSHTLADKLSDGSFTKDVTITNLGNEPLQSDYGKLRVSSLSCAVHSGEVDAQTICTHTLNSRLTLTQVSRQPVPHLLEQINATLVQASEPSTFSRSMNAQLCHLPATRTSPVDAAITRSGSCACLACSSWLACTWTARLRFP